MPQLERRCKKEQRLGSGPVDGIRSRKWKPDARVKLIEVLVTVGLRELVWI